MLDDIINVASYLQQQADENPDVCALKVPEKLSAGFSQTAETTYQTRTFLELEKESNSVAHLLQARGIQRGMRVLLMVTPGINLIQISFALFKIGAVPMIIDPGMGIKSLLNAIQNAHVNSFIGVPKAYRFTRIFFPYFRCVKIRIVAKSAGFIKEIKRNNYSDKFHTANTGPHDLAAILFTSGSTGAPKGVVYEHGMFDSQIRLIKNQYSIQPGEVDLPMLPIFALFNPALGMTTIVPQMNPSRPAKADPKGLVNAILTNEVSNSFGSPVLWHNITTYCEKRNIKLDSIKRVLMAGAPATTELMERTQAIIPNGTVYSPYGATEALPVSSIKASDRRKYDSGKGTCVGTAFPEVEVRIMRITEGPVEVFNPALMLAPGEVGEIIVKGPNVTQEYYSLQKETVASKIKDGDAFWHRMGDVGYLDKEGYLWFCGRKVERVCTAEKVYFTECCERIINQNRKVFRSALIGLGPKGQETPAMVIEPYPEYYPRNRDDEYSFLNELLQLAHAHEATRDIEIIFFYKNFPVDVRHNAKIHRLKLSECFSKKSKLLNI